MYVAAGHVVCHNLSRSTVNFWTLLSLISTSIYNLCPSCSGYVVLTSESHLRVQVISREDGGHKFEICLGCITCRPVTNWLSLLLLRIERRSSSRDDLVAPAAMTLYQAATQRGGRWGQAARLLDTVRWTDRTAYGRDATTVFHSH